MIESYLPILVLLLVAVVLGLLILSISIFIGPHPGRAREIVPYESGIRPLMSARRRFPVKFYLVAMLFIVFDIEIVFFFPWAVVFRQLQVFGLIEMLTFVAVLLVGYIYIVKKGVLDWD